MTELGWSMLLGTTLGLGLWCAVSAVPLLRRPRLMHRVAPYLLDVSQGARDLSARRRVNPLQVLSAASSPISDPVARILSQLVGTSGLVRLRLRQADRSVKPERYRALQLTAALIGAGIALAAGLITSVRGGEPWALVLLAPIGALLGAMALDWHAARLARARLRQLSTELPTVLEFIALALAAGESLADALRRIAETGKGAMASEFGAVVRDHASGVTLSEALARMDRELQHPPITRLVDQLRTALERGTPLAAVLQAQASDVREESKRTLLESAGKKEILMLVPLVFGLLPVTIAFALFPGLYVLQIGL